MTKPGRKVGADYGNSKRELVVGDWVQVMRLPSAGALRVIGIGADAAGSVEVVSLDLGGGGYLVAREQDLVLAFPPEGVGVVNSDEEVGW